MVSAATRDMLTALFYDDRFVFCVGFDSFAR